MFRIKVIFTTLAVSLLCLFVSGGILFASVSGFFLTYLREDLSHQTEKIAKLIEKSDFSDTREIGMLLSRLPLILNSETVVFDSRFGTVAISPDTAENLLTEIGVEDKLKLGNLQIVTGVSRTVPPARRRIFCAAPFTGTGTFRGGVLASLNILTGEARLRKAHVQILFALFVSFFIASIFGYFLSGWLTRPLVRIYEATIAFAAGDFKRRIAIRTGDEIGRTASVLNEMAARIDALITAQREFLADVSHEFKTPLTSIRGSAEALADGIVTDEKEVSAYLARIVAEAESLSSLVNDILEISKLESGAAVIETYAVDAVLAMQKALDDIAAGASARRIEVHTTLKENSSVLVQAEEKRLVRVFRNLLENAVNHSPEGSKIQVAHRENGGMVEFSVSDRGEGVPVQMRERIFERFFRLEHSRSRNCGGTGLGLSICKKTVEAFGGRIAFVDADEGFSTTVKFEIPEFKELDK